MEKDLATISELLTRLKALNSNLESTVKADYVNIIGRTLEEIATAGISTEEGDSNYRRLRLAADYQRVGEKTILNAVLSALESLSLEIQDSLKDTFELHMDKFVVAAKRHVSSLEHSLNVDFAVFEYRVNELLEQLRNVSVMLAK